MRSSVLLRAFAGLQMLGVISCTTINSDKTLKPSDAKELSKKFMHNLPGIFSLDQENKESVGDYEVPLIRNGNWIISSTPVSLVESFTQETNAIATVFVKVGDEFIRLSTTEPNEKPGTILSHLNPAYNRLIGEFRYTNRITLSGNDYMADYDVFRDRQGRIIGACLVGIPIEE